MVTSDKGDKIMIKKKNNTKKIIRQRKKKTVKPGLESNLGHQHGRLASGPLRHAAKDKDNWGNYYIF